jgi:hypothetical protein
MCANIGPTVLTHSQSESPCPLFLPTPTEKVSREGLVLQNDLAFQETFQFDCDTDVFTLTETDDCEMGTVTDECCEMGTVTDECCEMGTVTDECCEMGTVTDECCEMGTVTDECCEKDVCGSVNLSSFSCKQETREIKQRNNEVDLRRRELLIKKAGYDCNDIKDKCAAVVNRYTQASLRDCSRNNYFTQVAMGDQNRLLCRSDDFVFIYCVESQRVVDWLITYASGRLSDKEQRILDTFQNQATTGHPVCDRLRTDLNLVVSTVRSYLG